MRYMIFAEFETPEEVFATKLRGDVANLLDAPGVKPVSTKLFYWSNKTNAYERIRSEVKMIPWSEWEQHQKEASR